jgi:hypothetical protein
MRNILIVALVALLSSCALPNRLQMGGRDGLGNKVVSGKEEPATLVAVDGTLCTVPAPRFDRIKPGDRVWCNWRPRGGL